LLGHFAQLFRSRHSHRCEATGVDDRVYGTSTVLIALKLAIRVAILDPGLLSGFQRRLLSLVIKFGHQVTIRFVQYGVCLLVLSSSTISHLRGCLGVCARVLSTAFLSKGTDQKAGR